MRALTSLIAALLLLPAPAAAREVASGPAVEPRAAVAAPASRERSKEGRRQLQRLEEGDGFKVLNAAHAYGTPLAVRSLRQALSRYHARYPEAAPLLIMDLSRRGGGRLLPHASHRTGRDVDVRLVLNRPASTLVDASPRTLDAKRTWFLISALIETGQVEYVFLNRRLQRPIYEQAITAGLGPERLDEIFQYRHGRGRKIGIIRHEPGHLGHIHVRFRRAGSSPPSPTVQSDPSSACQIGALAWSRPQCHGLGRPL